MKVLAVGDIHTKGWIIYQVAEIINNYNAVVFVGDYADDWDATSPRTMITWDLLRTLQQSWPGKVHVLTGNHDFIYTTYTKTISSGYNRITQLLLDSPDSQELKEWLKNLPVKVELDGISYSHAGFTEEWCKRFAVDQGYGYTGVALWEDNSPIWVRPDDGYTYLPNQVFGHTPSNTCWEVEPSVWCIDTFSTYPDGTPVGDKTVLEVTDGKDFSVIKLKDENNDNDNTNRKSERLPRTSS